MWNSAQVFQSNGLSFSGDKLFFAKIGTLNDGTCCVSVLTCRESKLKISEAFCLFNFIHSFIISVVFFPASLGHVVVFFHHFLNVSCFILVHLHLILFQVTFLSSGPPVWSSRPNVLHLRHVLLACVRVSAFQFCPLLFSFTRLWLADSATFVLFWLMTHVPTWPATDSVCSVDPFSFSAWISSAHTHSKS